MRPSSGNAQYTLKDLTSIVNDVRFSGCFGRSNRQLQLFEYLLVKSLEGQSSKVTQYSIALDVIERPDSFDANSDSIVRVEMHRLRANLEVYNAGKFEYFITVPAATFQVLVKPKKQSVLGNLTKNTMSIAVATTLAMATFCIGYAMPQLHTGSNIKPASNFCSDALPNFSVNNVGLPSETQIYVEKVIRSTIAQQTSFNLVAKGEGCSATTEAPIFNFDYTLVEKGEDFSVVLSVVSNNTKNIISSHHINGDVSHTREGTDLYYEIVSTANAISMPDSVTARMAINENWQFESAKDAYSCMVYMYDSFSGGTDQDAYNVQKCLKDSLSNELVPLDNYGALALNYLDLARNLNSLESNEQFKLAESILTQNESDWVNSAELTIARLYYEAERTDFDADRFDLILSNAEMRYNSNPQVLLTVASFYGFSLGKWEKAKTISDYTKKIYSYRDQSIFEVDAGYALMNLDGEELMDECSNLYVETSLYVNVIINACSRKAKDLLWYELTEKNLSKFNASSVEEKLTVFDVARHDFKFIKTVGDNLQIDPTL